MKRLFAQLAPFLFLVFSLQAGFARSDSVETILEKALERAQWYRDQRIETQFSSDVLRISEKLNEGREVVEREELLYEAFPIGDYVFERLIERDGQPLSEKELEKEREREEEFRAKVDRGEDPVGQQRQQVFFDEKLVNKYNFLLEEEIVLNGRPTYVLSFKPKSADLPVETRLDRALNKAEGKIWVDSELHEIAQVNFVLKEKIGIWWGLIGSISELEGTVIRKPVDDEIWLPRQFQLYLNGRILFMSLHRKEQIEWRDPTVLRTALH